MSEEQKDLWDVEEEAPVEEAAQQETTPAEVEEDTSAGQPASAGSFTLEGNQLQIQNASGNRVLDWVSR